MGNFKIKIFYMKGISIIIPCFNREKTIKGAIESVINQNYYGNYEIIVSDDGSTDNSIKIAQNLGNKVVVLTKPEDCNEQGVSGARNRGIQVAQYDYICFLDSDDYYLPNYLNTLSKILDDNHDIGYAFCRVKQERLLSDGTVFIEDWTRKKLSYLDEKYHVLFRARNIHTNVILVRKLIIDKIGLFDTSISNGEDGDMWIRILEVTKGKFVDIYGAVYRINHGGNQLTLNSQEIKINCSIRINANIIERYLKTRDKDKMILYLAVRTLIFLSMTKKNTFFYKIIRRLEIMTRSFFLFPVTYVKFLCYQIRK